MAAALPAPTDDPTRGPDPMLSLPGLGHRPRRGSPPARQQAPCGQSSLPSAGPGRAASAREGSPLLSGPLRGQCAVRFPSMLWCCCFSF